MALLGGRYRYFLEPHNGVIWHGRGVVIHVVLIRILKLGLASHTKTDVDIGNDQRVNTFNWFMYKVS